MIHISDNELDKYLELNKLDLEIHMVSIKEKPKAIHSKVIIKSRLTGANIIEAIYEGMPDDDMIINIIKPFMRDKLLNSFI